MVRRWLAAVDTALGQVYRHVGDGVVGRVPTITDGELAAAFLAYRTAMVVIIWGPTLLVARVANPEGQRTMRAGNRVLTIPFFELARSWLPGLGPFPPGPLASAHFPSPRNTAAMVLAALATFGWAVRGGYRTPALPEVVERPKVPDPSKGPSAAHLPGVGAHEASRGAR